jgi:hypothetical protein
VLFGQYKDNAYLCERKAEKMKRGIKGKREDGR